MKRALASVAASLPITETIFLPIYYQSGSSIASLQVNQVDKDPPVLDGPHHTVSKQRTTPNKEEQGPQASNSGSHIFLDRWAIVQTILGQSVSKVPNARTKLIHAS